MRHVALALPCTRRYDRARLRQGREEGHDMAGGGLRQGVGYATTRHLARAVVAQCARCWVRVCTLCTQPSLESGHYSESPFGGTIHEHCS